LEIKKSINKARERRKTVQGKVMSEIEEKFKKWIAGPEQIHQYQLETTSTQGRLNAFKAGYLAGVEVMKEQTKDLVSFTVHPDVVRQLSDYTE
jgi:hypothetical protein